MNTEQVIARIAQAIAELRKHDNDAGPLANVERKIEAIVSLVEALHGDMTAQHAERYPEPPATEHEREPAAPAVAIMNSGAQVTAPRFVAIETPTTRDAA